MSSEWGGDKPAKGCLVGISLAFVFWLALFLVMAVRT